VDTIRVSDEMNVDIAPDGTVYGIELLNANAQLVTLYSFSTTRQSVSQAVPRKRFLPA